MYKRQGLQFSGVVTLKNLLATLIRLSTVQIIDDGIINVLLFIGAKVRILRSKSTIANGKHYIIYLIFSKWNDEAKKRRFEFYFIDYLII